MRTMEQQEMSPQGAMLQMITAFWLPQAIHTVAKWRVPDFLKDGPKTSAELARDTQTHEEALHRVLRTLSSVGVFAETEDGRFGLTPLSQTLRSDVPDSLWGYLMLVDSEWFWRAWAQLPHAVKTGQPGFEQAHGQPFFEYLSKHPDDGVVFNKAMTSFSAMSGSEVVPDRYDFSKVKTVVDVAGGQGSFLVHVLSAHPQLRGVLFELPPVIEEARSTIEKSGVAGRCTLLGGSFFESVPSGHDLYMMKMIIHDWADDHAVRILKSCRQAMRNDSKLLLIEQLLPERRLSGVQMFIDLTMMTMFGSKERTAKDFQALFAQAGLELTRTIELVNGYAIIEAQPRE
ncbi:acetylserotonin O-methyltransferase [Archangium lipolyticum]|uniref:acetylserotonin O-methyltransferase n=1 Tax=Archangium lipolyticum TaxID=2970465 RepID=UPI002149B595|nr:acetylserotonin O-methyltransferase [Archangium lipolyticum]